MIKRSGQKQTTPFTNIEVIIENEPKTSRK